MTTSVSGSLSSHSLMSLSQSRVAVGSTWMLSSMLLTTYYSTAFLKHGNEQTENDFQRRHVMASIRKEAIHQDSQKAMKQRGLNAVGCSILLKYYTRPQLLTIFRLSGSFLLGIFAHPNFSKCVDRFRQSLSVMKDFAFPAIFMFFANYCNVIALDRLGISLTYTSKCGIPILTGEISTQVYIYT